jgi:hypothetical protein
MAISFKLDSRISTGYKVPKSEFFSLFSRDSSRKKGRYSALKLSTNLLLSHILPNFPCLINEVVSRK